MNIKGAIKWGIIGFFSGLTVGVFVGNSSANIFWMVVAIFVVVFAFIGARSKTPEQQQAYAASLFISDEGLTKNQKIVAWVFSIINPVITGGILYFMWRYKYPQKAKQANNISLIVFILEIVFAFVLLSNK